MKLKLLLAAAIGILFAGSCRKDTPNNPLDDQAKIEVGSYLTLTETVNLNVDFADPASTAAIKVGSVGSSVDKIDMFVVEGSNLDASTWNMIKTVAYTGEGTELSATNAELKAVLGADLQPGVQYTIYNRITTKDGRTFDLTNAGLNVEAPDFNSAFEWTVSAVAPFTGNMAGNYKVIQDDWQDYSVGAVITGAVDDGPGANQITLHVYPSPAFGTPVNPIIVDIDQPTGVATVPAVVYGDYGVLISAEGGGYVFSATGTVDLTLRHFAGATEYGTYRLVIKKQ